MTIDPSARSKQDVLEIAQYIAQDSPRAAVRFLDCVEETYDILSAHPTIGHSPVFNFVEGLQTVLIKGFKHYHVFYRVLDDVIRIDRVADGRRDPPSLFAYIASS